MSGLTSLDPFHDPVKPAVVMRVESRGFRFVQRLEPENR